MEDRDYTNRFMEVRRKAEIFTDRLSEANKDDAELREKKSDSENREYYRE